MPQSLDDGEAFAGWLHHWLEAHDVPGDSVRELTPVGGGTQNQILRFERGGTSLIYRAPPPSRAGALRSLERECRILQALDGTDVPHPRLVASCLLDEPNAPFYVMEVVEGVNPTIKLPAAYSQPEWGYRLAMSIVDVAATIGEVDYRALGLANLERGNDFLERQVPRWHSQLDSYRLLGDFDPQALGDVRQIESWLTDNCPATYTPGLAHGDFHLANMLCSTTEPVVTAIVDWELATIGDPLLDLGWLFATWASGFEGRPGTVGPLPWIEPPPESELVARYAARSGRDLSQLIWYKILACYKLAVVLEGTYARSRVGQAPVDVGKRLHSNALGLLERAQFWLDGS